MKGSGVVKLRARDIKGNLNAYDLFSSRIVQIRRDHIESSYLRRETRNVSCQCNIRKNSICTCRKLAPAEPTFFSFPKQVYRYSDWRSFTDIGVGSVKALARKRIKKIYLPERIDRAVGSVDLTSYINRKNKQRTSSYYDNKKTSSKCVGGFIENENVSHVSKKLSPIVQTKSGTTSPKCDLLKEQNKNIASYNVKDINTTTMPTQVDTDDFNCKEELKNQSTSSKIKPNQVSKQTIKLDVIVSTGVQQTDTDKLKSSIINTNKETCKDFSSDSFVQHVHNLENPSNEKLSKTSVDPIENKLEREYRKIFTTYSKDRSSIDKPMQDFKSASLLRRRFEALRRGMGKKESKKGSSMMNKPSSHASPPSRKDVSIASDPPSLEGRSYSNTKVYSPLPLTIHDSKAHPKVSYRKSSKGKKGKDNSPWPTDMIDSKYESVQGMFKLWGKKFNLDEECCKPSPNISNVVAEGPEKSLKLAYQAHEVIPKKKQGKRFFFFGKKDKNKENKPYKPKKGVTAGRCEVKDGLMIKMGGTIEHPPKELNKKHEKHVEEYNVLRNAWLERFITNAGESRNSVHIRWNNNMYATSSSTVLELMDSVYKHTGIGFGSRSDMSVIESSNYRSFNKQRVHFMHQDVETWMIPKLVTDKEKKIRRTENDYYSNENRTKNIPIEISNQRWFVDASKGLSQTIELLLRANPNSKSSDYIIINIPEGYFSKSSSIETRTQSSDEKIYKIVEYDTSDLKKIKENCHIATGDIPINNTKVTVSVQNDTDKKDKASKTSEASFKRPLLRRDVAIQGSNVFIPKRCDVIGVGIITQRDIRDVRNPILKIEDDLSDEDSGESRKIQKKCELAESYLQEYCRNWMPSGIDAFSWQLSDSHVRSSENISVASLNQGDGTKSCSNMYDEYQGSTLILSSCETSSCSHCMRLEEDKKQDDSLKFKILKKFKKNSTEVSFNCDKRYCPKDSLEVFKRRQLYASNNQKSKWCADYDRLSNCSSKTDPSSEENKNNKKKKHVSLPGCETADQVTNRRTPGDGILSFKGSSCNRKGSGSLKQNEVLSRPNIAIPQPPCKEFCLKAKKQHCNKKNAPYCDQIFDELPPPPFDTPENVQPKTRTKSISPCSDKLFAPPRENVLRPKQTGNECLGQQLSKLLSQDSGVSLKKDACSKVSTKNSDEYLNNVQKSKICKPCRDCKKRSRSSTPSPTPPPICQTPRTDSSDSNKPMTGLHLKKLPSKKRTCSDENIQRDCDGPRIIRLNSKETVTIRMKKETPSTEEIREAVNIRVQDEDGQTLYERIDYKQSGEVNKCNLLKDTYKNPVIRRISTPTNVKDGTAQINHNEMQEKISDTSIDNLIEINFTLKLKKGDKGTEFNIKNGDDLENTENIDENAMNIKKDVFIVQDQADHNHAPIDGNKKDVNIKIVIKNYNTDKNNESETNAMSKNNDNFTKTIADKFHTVSTGYSDIIDENTFSIRRDPEDLALSAEECKDENKHSQCTVDKKITEDVTNNQIPSSQSEIERSVTEQTINMMTSDKEEKNSNTSLINSITMNGGNSTTLSHDNTDDRFDGSKSENYSSKENNKCPDDITETSNENILKKKQHLHNRAQKKEMLKKLFQSSSAIKKPENKKRIKKIIRAILTSDSSVNEDITVTSNELTKELTYDYMSSRFYKDTDSMNNYYQTDSELSDEYKGNVYKKLNPTKNNSECSENYSKKSFEEIKNRGCMCSALANKLNLTQCGGGVCRCRKTINKEQEINCNLKTDDYLLNLNTYTDVDTQNSQHISNKVNSANLSVRSKTQSIVITNASVIIKNSVDNYAVTNRKRLETFISEIKDFCSMQRLNGENKRLSDSDILVVNSNLIANSNNECYGKALYKNAYAAANILQLNETKKAVLEIYAEKIVSDEGERIVAKLPKFDLDKEKDISKIENVATGRRRISKRNFVMMSINQ